MLEDSAAPDVRAARATTSRCATDWSARPTGRVGLEQYRKDFPNDSRASEVAFQLGDLDEAAGKLDEAKKEFETALASRPSSSLAIELYYRMGRLHEQKGETAAALRAYEGAVASPDRDHPYRLSAVARCAALYEAKKDFPRALASYRDIMRNAKDPELVARRKTGPRASRGRQRVIQNSHLHRKE